jgi:CRISPR-associated endonuclease/helicase Cas3
MSIIDQNYDVIATVLSTQSRTPLTTDLLLKHHHLSDISYSTNDDEYDEDAAQLMIEGWQSEFIITTFVQFFHSILSNRNRAIRKYHTIANAIIILDEVQAIPPEYWLLFREIIKTIAQHLHATVIFVTATQPLIFNEESGDLIELVSDKKQYFSKLNRVNLHIAKEPESIDEFIEKVRDHIKCEPEKDFLIVLNTISTAKRVYTSLAESDKSQIEYFYLSTHIIPKERLKRIRKIKEKTSKTRKIIVSTQLIEAGVDIDVDVVYRDMAPLDSINQVAGRCNRNGRNESPGEVNIVTIQDDHRQLWGYIYSQHLISQTKILFENSTTIAEHEILNLNNRYYHLVEQTLSVDLAKKCLSYVRCLKFSDLQEEFHLIHGEYPKTDVFVECEDKAREIWQHFVKIKTKPPLERRQEFLKIKKQFFDYVISVPANKFSIPDDDNRIGRITQAELIHYYDKETGFSPKDGGTLMT